MNRRTLSLLLVVVALACAVVATVSAFMIKRWENNEDPTFSAAEVKCEVTQTGNTITVKNTGNVSAYIRVQLVVNWYNGENLYYEPTTDLTVADNTGWQRSGNTFYYSAPVGVNGAVELSLGDDFKLGDNKIVTETDKGGTEIVYSPKLEIIADAVQAEPANAVTDVWNVTLNGSQISGIKED